MTEKFLSGSDIDYFLEIIKTAGSEALKLQKGIIDIHRKSDNTIVTDADLWVQNFLIDRISARFKEFNFISEESISETTKLAGDKTTVIIDPIDGTAMFSMHLPLWCVSIGIFQGYKPSYGFVFSPGSDLLFYTDDENSYLNGTKLTVSHNIPIEKETNIFYSSEIKGVKINFPGKVRNLGSTALHACLTADNRRNRLLAFIGKSYLWDWAGAIPVIEKAGGHIRYLDGREIDYRKIIANGFEFEDYAVAYNTENFKTITDIFHRG